MENNPGQMVTSLSESMLLIKRKEKELITIPMAISMRADGSRIKERVMEFTNTKRETCMKVHGLMTYTMAKGATIIQTDGNTQVDS